jgi:flagellar biosynthesis/type III secretory pathway chaperone
MQSELCRDHVQKLLSAEIQALAVLETLLDREHELLRQNDIDALEKAGAERQESVIELLRVEDERQELCRMLGYPNDLGGLEQLLRWCDPQGALAKLWGDCAQRAGRCRDHNLRNGALVAARMQRIEGVLGALTGRSQTAKLYDPQGGMQTGSYNKLTVRA